MQFGVVVIWTKIDQFYKLQLPCVTSCRGKSRFMQMNYKITPAAFLVVSCGLLCTDMVLKYCRLHMELFKIGDWKWKNNIVV